MWTWGSLTDPPGGGTLVVLKFIAPDWPSTMMTSAIWAEAGVANNKNNTKHFIQFILTTVRVEAVLPMLAVLAVIRPPVDEISLHEIRMLAAGDARTPDNVNAVSTPPEDARLPADADAITVVPSHNLHANKSVLLDAKVTVPDANHVPEVPCAVLGPSKKVEVLFKTTLLLNEFETLERFVVSVQVPVVEILQVPLELKPVLAVMVTLVSVPALPQAGVEAPCVRTCPFEPGANTNQLEAPR